VTRVRDSTGAMVRVLEQNKGQRRLESGEEVDEVIEIQGLPQSCDSALQAVADLLRQYQVGFDTYPPEAQEVCALHYQQCIVAAILVLCDQVIAVVQAYVLFPK